MNHPLVKRLNGHARLGMAVLFLLSSVGCFHRNAQTGDEKAIKARIAGMRSFYVRTHPDDDYNLGRDVVSQLREMGYQATSGPAVSPPDPVDGVITYLDRWEWGFTIRMLRLDMKLREPETDVVLEDANSSSLPYMHRSQQEIVREALDNLLKGGKSGKIRRR
ncbi:hypothetical protein JIN84_16170 [Luteolibacter yonseiensis]|uniref:Lipoprotein n=1 Tax=Luteolibacter yonseiensis TaxID=1144680 RepID=A0A934R697_9BACT|nr:hypothetical protein [Luteolibacter yonseiensis]MBK1817157.1 hypothetical protein [Luteolibacter yonseiensis]